MKAKDFIKVLSRIPEDTVYIDEKSLEECMEQYANQRVIEELEHVLKEYYDANQSIEIISNRIDELR
tara:strand:- start:66 stop:266 length:201 start_codon:yes stop_codon:yes gene_type:complete